MNKVVVVTSTLTLAAYIAVAASPNRLEIGRGNPVLAAFFSPPGFNFLGSYTDGSVLEFKIGMLRDELVSALRNNYFGRGHVVADCYIGSSRALVPLEEFTDVKAMIIGADSVCLYVDSPRIGARFVMNASSVSEIEVWRVNFEGT